MSSSTQLLAKLKSARTVDDWLESVPVVAESNSPDTLSILAGYDRQSPGWFETFGSWIVVILPTALLTLTLLGMIAVIGEWLVSAATSTAEQSRETIPGLLLRLAVYLLAIILTLLVFYFAGPRKWIVDSTGVFRKRVRLRVLLLSAIRARLNRNRGNVGNNWRRAVCRNCLALYERYLVRFAYCRWLSFARCRICHSDQAAYTRVRKIQGWADRKMAGGQDQVGDVVRVNLLHRLSTDSTFLPNDLHELVIGSVEDDEVEAIVFLYRREQPHTNLPKPKRLRCHLRNSNASAMAQRQLKRNFSLITV